MDKTTLVERDLEAGEQIVRDLERAGIRVDLAAWLQDDDHGSWHLVISTPALTVDGGTDHAYEALMMILADVGVPDLHLGVVSLRSPNNTIIQNLKNLVRTGDALQRVSLSDLDLGPKWFRSAIVYRSHGGRGSGRWLEHGANVRAKQTGKQGIVYSRERAADGGRYLVRHFLAPKDRLPKNGVYPPPDEQLYDQGELEFLYAVRPGGWPEKPPLVARPA